ncbi:MAG: hypothetical protein K0U78_02610 [Actinomycetia bacterium]|nr:hypothetical protein [Actinomycetes bacterium]
MGPAHTGGAVAGLPRVLPRFCLPTTRPPRQQGGYTPAGRLSDQDSSARTKRSGPGERNASAPIATGSATTDPTGKPIDCSLQIIAGLWNRKICEQLGPIS